jgi:signal transduction histidine kinase
VASRRDVVLAVALAVVGAAFGISAEIAAGAPLGLALAFLDLAVGLLLLCFGIVVRVRRPASWTGAWMALAGLAWFAGTLAWALVYLHRGFLVLLLLTYPSGRLSRSRVARVAIGVAIVDSIVVPLARNDRLTVALGVLVAVAALHLFRSSGGMARRAAVPALLATLAFASTLVLGAGLRLAGVEAERAVLSMYDLVIVGIGTVLFVDLLRAPWSEAVLKGLVAELGWPGSMTLKRRLARAVGDPTLVVGVWDDERHAYLDASGASVALPAEGSGRIATRIDDHGAPLALLIHDETAVHAEEVIAPVAALVRIAVANASLERRIEERARDVAASRRRLVEAADAERRALQQTLARGPERRLRRVSQLLARSAAADGGTESPALQELVESAIGELNDLANGLHPAELDDGLDAALPALAARSALEVSVLARTRRLPAAIEAAAYFVCSEALANAAKHAQADSAQVEAVTDADRLHLSVSDDGVGGAEADGAGLRGLADRVEALGVRLHVESPPGAGTRVLAEIPCN